MNMKGPGTELKEAIHYNKILREFLVLNTHFLVS